ncbi:DUF309 domain-containing protein [Bremerella cremea]|uniref:DUF309 domain-containing protein n=1 Tax=Bremerella cremea TaxID=1031537 RepID=UPI0031E6B096
MVNRIARYEPDFPLPEYAYVPGINTRPTTSLEGESPARLLRVGVDLFHHGFYWEAHEAWEACWIAAGRRGAKGDLLRGLIHLAASGVKARQGSQHGVQTHAEKTCLAWSELSEDLDLASLSELTEQVRKVCQTPKRFLCDSQENVVVVFDIRIELARG